MNNGSNSSTTNGRTTNNSVQSRPTTRPFNNNLAGNVSRSSTALVAVLNRGFSGKCNFPILSRIIDRQSSPELMKTKETVKGIPQIEFRTLSEFSKQIQDNSSRLQNYRREIFLNRAFISNEPHSKQLEEFEGIFSWVNEEQNNFGTSGVEFIGQHTRAIIESRLRISREADKVGSKIGAIHILRENTEYWQGFWDAIKDKLVPDIASAGPKAVKSLLILVNWVAELIVSGVVYNKSWERKKFLEVLDTWEDMLTSDHKLILATRDEMSNYLKFMANAKTLWASEVDFVWATKPRNFNLRDAINQYESCLRDLERTERMLSLTTQPFEQALEQIYPLYGPGISVQRTTRDFCDHVPYISIRLKKLLTAKGIIADGQEEQFEEKVYCLARIIYGRLQTIIGLCAQWSRSIDPGELETFLQEGTVDFIHETDRVIQAIRSMLRTENHDSKRKQALKKRMEWDRRYKNWSWNDRPLVTSAGANEVLEDLEAIIMVIHRLSVSTGTGTNMLSIGRIAEVRRSHVEFNHSNLLLSEFFDVLEEETQRGSMEFPEKREKQRTETQKSHGGLFKRQWKKWRGAKPAAPTEELGFI